MKYLFGDSTPFPGSFDFLATLEVFMTAATKVVQLVGESQRQSEANAFEAEARVHGIRAVQVFNGLVVEAIDRALVPPFPEELGVPSPTEPHEAMVNQAKRLKDSATRGLEELRRSHKDQTESDAAGLRSDIEKRTAQIKGALETFFKSAKLHIISSRVTMKLLEGKEPRNELCAVFRNQGDVVTSFVLGTQGHAAWNGPRKVSDFAPQLDLVVGIKKSFFGNQVTPQVVHLADHVVSHADVHDLGCELGLRKRFDQKENYVFKLSKADLGWRGIVERLDDPNANMLPPELSPEDLNKVLAVCHHIRDAMNDLLHQREQMLRLELDGRDVYANGLSLQLVTRLVTSFAPTVEAIVQRSPSAQELSLKKEHEDGRREELYLRRDDLLKKLAPLHAEGRGVFAPLGLDDWVPTMTMRPPEVR
jgi:hypothetical protein